MKKLPLYDGTPSAAVDRVDPLPLDPDCERCSFHEGARNVCMKPSGVRGDREGTLLVIAAHPTKQEDRLGRTLSRQSASVVHRVVKQSWGGSYVCDNAIKCAPTGKVAPKHIDACRPYLAHMIDEVRPDRIIVLGRLAAQAVLGRSIPVMSTRKGYGWLVDDTPVFILMDPKEPATNKFIKEWFVEDLRWACTANVRQLKANMPWKACAVAWVLETEDKAAQAAARLAEADIVGFDTETGGRMFCSDFRIFSIGFACDTEDDAYVVEAKHTDDRSIMDPLLELLEDEDLLKCAHNSKFDMQAVWLMYGTDCTNVIDTSMLAKIVDPEAEKKLAVQEEKIGLGGGKEISDEEKARIRKLLRGKKSLSDDDIEDMYPGRLTHYAKKVREVDTGKVDGYIYALYRPNVRARYVGIDALASVRLAEHYLPQVMGHPARRNVWENLAGPSIDSFVQMQRWGCPVSRTAVETLCAHLTEKRDELLELLQAEYENPHPKGTKPKDLVFNPNSHPQVRAVLYEELGYRVVNQTDAGNAATDESTLALLHKKKPHPFLETMLEFRRITKLLGYPQGWPEYICDDGRFHPNYKPDGARSGRPSCEAPNLFNLPRAGTPEGAMCRDCVQVEDDDSVLYVVDLSQAELRVLAALSDDPEMIAIFQSGADYHRRTAQLVSKALWNVAPEDITDEHRSKAKAVNFGLVYGKTARSLARDMGASVQEAEMVLQKILGRFKKMDRWRKEREREARATGGVWTEWPVGTKARWRPLFRIAGPDKGAAITARNGATNSPVQGGASDICLDWMARMIDWIKTYQPHTRLVLTVYDSLLFEARKRDIAALDEACVRMAEDRDDLRGVPMVADAEVGRSWGHTIKLAGKPGERVAKETGETLEEVLANL